MQKLKSPRQFPQTTYLSEEEFDPLIKVFKPRRHFFYQI